MDPLRRAHWNRVPVTPDVEAAPFLDAAEGLGTLFEALRTIGTKYVKDDYMKNIRYLRETVATQTPKVTLRTLLKSEKRANRTTGDCAWVSYIWLTRSLRMVAAAIRWVLEHPNDEISTAFDHAYQEHMYKHHSWAQYLGYRALLVSLPSKRVFLTRLGHPPLDEIREYFTAMNRVLAQLPPAA